MKKRTVTFYLPVSCMMLFMLAGRLCAENDTQKTSALPEDTVAKPAAAEVHSKALQDYADALKKGHEAESDGKYCDAASFFMDARKKLQDDKSVPMTESVQKKIVDAWCLEIDALLNNFSPETAEKSLNKLQAYLTQCSKGNRTIADRFCHGDVIQLFHGRIALLRREKRCVDILRPLADQYRTRTTVLNPIPSESVFFYYGLACELNDDYNKAIDSFSLVATGSLALHAWEHMTFCKIRNGSFEGRGKLRTDYDERKQKVSSADSQKDVSDNLASIDLLEVYCSLKFDSNDSNVLQENVAKLKKILEPKLSGSMQQFHCIVLYDIAGILMSKEQTRLAFNIYDTLYKNSTAAEKTEIIAPWLFAWSRLNDSNKADYAIKLVKRHLKDFKNENISPETKVVAAQLLLKNHDYNDAIELYSQVFRTKKDIQYFQHAVWILVNDSSLDDSGKEQKFKNLLVAYYGSNVESSEAYEQRGFFYKTFNDRKKQKIGAQNFENSGDIGLDKKKKLEAYKKAAESYFQLQNLEALEQVADKILKLDPSNIVLCQCAELARQKGYMTKAHENWEAFVRFKNVGRKERCEALSSNGKLYLEDLTPDYRQAYLNFEKILSEKLSDDIDVLANSALGMVVSATHHKDERMLQTCVQHLTSEPLLSCESETMGAARLELALFYYYNNNPETARNFMEEIRLKNKSNSQFVEAIICMAKIMLQRGDERVGSFLSKNEQDFKEKPNSCRIYYLWGNILKEKEQYADAIVKYQQAEDAKPLLDSDVVQAAVGAHGDCLFAMEKYQEAQEKFLKLKNLNSALNRKYELMTMYKYARCGQMKSSPDDWETIADVYLKLLQARSVAQLKENPADVFWVMKAFEEMRILIISHIDDPKCISLCDKVQKRNVELREAKICTVYLNNIWNDIETAWKKNHGIQ